MEVDNPTEKLAPPTSKRSYYVGSSALAFRRQFMEIEQPIKNSLVRDWDAYEELLQYGFASRFQLDPKEYPILLAEPSFNLRSQRKKATELLFEKFGVPAAFLSKAAVLAAFASGRSSGLVLDSGGGVTSTVAVSDGYVLPKTIGKSVLAGERLTDELYKIYQKKKISIKPHYCIKRTEVVRGEWEVKERTYQNLTKSYHEYFEKRVLEDVKENVLRVSEDTFDEVKNENIPSVQYELPDGNVLDVYTERFTVPEYMFCPENMSEKEDFVGVHNMVYNTISKCNSDVHRELYNSIIVTGGNSLLPGFSERLNKELFEIVSQKFKLVTSNLASERKFSVWIGGSILASLGTFQQIWMSKAEFEEHGSDLVERKFP
eukprot:TRINITY_DN8782_c0_g7_i1.p1 TRINITY_DN8782_c0_g7~~TRINITY_DN8782_c0_g7_i1.p1  ORF type:complete len:374 (+),score=63.94 TRINITY_DN8782_c0_g7_i1:251-1372(+)